MVNLNVSVPAGQIPGNTLTVVTPSGQSLTVIIPAGVAAGGTFQITVPDNMATAAAVTMAVPTEVPAPAVPVRASIDTGTPVIGRAIGQAQANSGLAPMETSVSRGPPQPTQRVKQAKEAVFCTSAVTMVFSILLIGTVGGVLGLATSWTISCCTTGHIKLAKKAKEIRALAISALAFTATGALVAVVIGGALLSDGSNCVAESPYNLGSCSTNPYNGTKDIPFNGTKGPGFVEAGGYNPNVSAYDDGCSPDYCESDLGHPDSLSSPGEPRCFVPGNEERCKCSRGEARVIGRHLIYVHHVHAYDIWYEFTCCPNDGNERENPPVVDRCGVGTTTPDGRRLESAAAADDDDDDDDDEVDARPFHEKLLSATGVIASLVQRKGEALGGDVGRRGAKALTGAWLAEALGFERFRSTPTVGPAAVAGGDAAAGASRKRRLLANDDSCKSCTHSWCHDETKNGWCQDGSYGSHSSECPCGTDLTDCGTRSAEQCGFDSFEHVKNDNSCEPPYAAIGGYSQLYSAHPKARPKTGCDVGTHGCGPGWGRRMDDGDGGGGDDEDGFPACYSGPACAGIAHGCYDCSILKESDCDGLFNTHLTDLELCAEGTEPKVAGGDGGGGDGGGEGGGGDGGGGDGGGGYGGSTDDVDWRLSTDVVLTWSPELIEKVGEPGSEARREFEEELAEEIRTLLGASTDEVQVVSSSPRSWPPPSVDDGVTATVMVAADLVDRLLGLLADEGLGWLADLLTVSKDGEIVMEVCQGSERSWRRLCRQEVNAEDDHGHAIVPMEVCRDGAKCASFAGISDCTYTDTYMCECGTQIEACGVRSDNRCCRQRRHACSTMTVGGLAIFVGLGLPQLALSICLIRLAVQVGTFIKLTPELEHPHTCC